MTRNFAKFIVASFVAAAVFAALIPAAYAQDGRPQMAPLNPAFVQYLEALKLNGAAKMLKTPYGHGMGEIPSPVIAIVGSPSAKVSKNGINGSYQASYDLRTDNKVTPVKDQGQCGDCWAFAAMSSMESYFRPGETLDLSEADLNANSGFDFGSCQGGNVNMSAAYLARWDGPLLETSTTVVKHAQNMIFLTPRADAADNDRIKGALLAYGGLAVALYWSDTYYNPNTHAYYDNVPGSSNHEVTIIGWDDNYPKTNFSIAPAGNGAFLCKNSWGTSWGDSGYFYVSYYDGVFARGSYVAAFTGEPVTDYTRVYSYDKLGWDTDMGFNSTVAWASNIFTAAANEGLSAVGFYTNDTHTDYTVYVYTGVTAGQPTSGIQAYSVSGSFDSPGYYTVPVGYHTITAGQLFSAVVKITNANNKFPIPVEMQITGYSGGASASGNSYISSDGSAWQALTGIPVGTPTNVTLKAYAATRPPTGVVALKDSLFRPLKNPAVKCKINVTLFAGGNVTIKAYTINGGFVKTIYNGPQSTGAAVTYSWDGKNSDGTVVASGLYLIHISGPGTHITEKVVVIK